MHIPKQFTNHTEAQVLDYHRRQAVYIFLCTGNKAEAYRYWLMNTTKDGTLSKNYSKQTHTWFNSNTVQATLQVIQTEVEERHFLAYCKRKGLSVSGILKGASEGLAKKQTDENDRDLLRAVLKQRYEDQYNEAVSAGNIVAAISANKEMVALMDAKYRQDEIDNEKNNIVFYLPAPICDTCPNRDEVISKFSNVKKEEDEVVVEEDNVIKEEDEFVIDEDEPMYL